ncbi:DegT/DnrJ/EryC1/StrS family aminotransferase [Marixanthomonas ophiurae]|uniref:Aminotransferase class I/II-fold pyridoxal phosphate-dependent enzyme n=1 Tax=Marixanthomonas ophiurae TaxID=387659 RepID=A0A3E1Q787_9FLAO|nr:aminotransferase class I/II-fold pyridoxal phosphate-dependent enzyme [Marixanthomonas ophiurae]RFN57984.1 aminotransferase class I/II-fold pyridoxal phosphate-dependent enzyme [Marixanthomonas ophiurae]
MSKSKIWLSSPHMGGNEQKYIEEAFAKNWIAPLGPNVTGFEQDLESYLGEDSHVACVSSGTGAIHLALDIAGVTAGDEVLCQTFTFCGSSHPITYMGATPVFIDSEEETWNMFPKYLEEAIKDGIANGKKPKAVIAVHLYGMPAKIDEIEAICKKYNIFLIEDAAEALGSSYKNRKCGTFGDISILSFNGNKIITTSGGGALVCRDKETKDKAIFLATQARDEAPHYQHSRIGYNYRMSNIVAGIGRGQMEVLDKHVALRRENNVFYQKLFSTIEEIQLFSEPDSNFYSNHWLSAITLKKSDNQQIIENLRLFLHKFNIESRPLWKPMHVQPVYYGSKFYGNGTAIEIFKKGLCLPSGSNLTDSERDRIKNAVRMYFS